MPPTAAREPAQGYYFCCKGFICLKPSKVKKAPLSFVTGWEEGSCVLLFSLIQIWQVLVEDLFPGAGGSWLCAGSGSAGGLGMEQSCGAGMLRGWGIKAFVSLELTSLRVHLPFPR